MKCKQTNLTLWKAGKINFMARYFFRWRKMLGKIISPPQVFKSFFLERNIFRRTKLFRRAKLFLKSFSANEIFFCGLKSFSSDEKYFCGFKTFEKLFLGRKIFLRFENLFLVFKSSSTRFWGHESCPQNRVESYYSYSIIILISEWRGCLESMRLYVHGGCLLSSNFHFKLRNQFRIATTLHIMKTNKLSLVIDNVV